MLENRLISDNELSNFGEVCNLSEKAEALLKHQRINWNLAEGNFSALDYVKIKEYNFGDFNISTQFNPSRILSSSAKVDRESIENRKCFLCLENLPEVQKGVLYKEKYIILVNPYPIFKQHLTIPNVLHLPQLIEDCFSDLLDISKDLSDKFFVFYNGPKCGASAPDHLHFQAGLKNSTPLEKHYPLLLERGLQLFKSDNLTATLISEDIFNFICIQSDNKNKIETGFKKILVQLKKLDNFVEEPLLNIISLYENNMWNLFIVPRKKHRPDQFFAEDDSKLLISPASVDMMGLLITPRKEDFENLTQNDIADIYNQVLYKKDELKILSDI